MPHKRYQNPNKGYSRRQQKELTAFSIATDLHSDEPIDAARFAPDSVTALMAGAPGSDATTPREMVDGPLPTSVLAQLMQDAAVPVVRAPQSSMAPAGAASPPGDAVTDPRIARLDRLLDAIKKAR